MLAAATLASLALFCHGQHAPPTPEQERQQRLEGYAETRAHFGFRSDIPYIEELIRRGRHESDVGYVPVTRAEDRYLRLRDRIGLGHRAYRYLRKRRELSGGVSIEDGWPGEPYLLVRLTRDRAMHEANLRRLVPFPRNLRTVEVTYSDRELRRLGQRIWNDERELAAAGFDLRSLSVDVDTNTAEIGLITQRTDHAEYFAQRYGPVTTELIATEPTKLECSEAGSYRISATGRSLVVRWGTGGGAKLETVELTEHADRVEVGIVERVPNGFRTLELRFVEHRVALSAPLGERPVIDAATGLQLRQRGPSPGDPPCPRARPKSTLDEYVAQRRRVGLRHERAFVRRMLRRALPFTEAERRYLAERDELQKGRIAAYLRRHRGESGGWEVRGRFPEPWLVARFTRRVAFHRRDLERLTDGRVRVHRSRYTLAALRRVERRIWRAFEDDGQFVDGVLIRDARVEGGRVIVEVVTAREDYATALRELYGPAVKAVRTGTRPECVPDPFAPF